MAPVYFKHNLKFPTLPIRPTESHIFAKFVPLLTTLCMLGLNFSSRFMSIFKVFIHLRIMPGKCTSHHLFFGTLSGLVEGGQE